MLLKGRSSKTRNIGLLLKRKKYSDLKAYIVKNMVPIKDIVLGLKMLPQKNKVERYTRSYKNAADKEAVGFIADLG